MFTSIRIGEFAITPKTAEAQATLAILPKNEEGLKAAKVLSTMFEVTPVDFCQLLDKPTNVQDLYLSLVSLAQAANSGNTVEVLNLFAEFEGAYNSAVNPIREKYGVSSRYHFDIGASKWIRKESIKREVAVGEPKTAKVLVHRFTYQDGKTAENTNGGKLYAEVRGQIEKRVCSEHTDFKSTAIPFFNKHGKYDTYEK